MQCQNCRWWDEVKTQAAEGDRAPPVGTGYCRCCTPSAGVAEYVRWPWTKPDDIRFDPADPFAALQLEHFEFLIARMDGAIGTHGQRIGLGSSKFKKKPKRPWWQLWS